MFMSSLFAPVVPLGRLEWDAAQSVLQTCSPHRQTAALPYLLAMYSFMAWWENEAQAGDGECERELSLTTTWCEQPEVLELINLADLNVEGVQLGFYPLEAGQTSFEIHCPTFLGVLQADLAVAVELDRHTCKAKFLGFLDRATLVQHWQTTPPDSQGLSQVPVELLQPIYYLPEQISYLYPAPAQPSPKTQAKASKTNRNHPQPTSGLATDVQQLTAKLLQLGVTPPNPGLDGQSLDIPEKISASAPDGSSLNRLIQALQVYHGTSSPETINLFNL